MQAPGVLGTAACVLDAVNTPGGGGILLTMKSIITH